MVSGFLKPASSFLERFLYEDPYPFKGGPCLTDQSGCTHGCLTIGKEIIDQKDPVLLADIIRKQGEFITGSLGKGHDSCLVYISFQDL